MKNLSRRGVILLLATAVSVIGTLVLVSGFERQVSAPAVHVSGQTNSPSAQNPKNGGTITSAPLGPSQPIQLLIPALGIDTPVNSLGLNPDGTLAVPQPGPHLNQAAWFKNSPTPGQPGASVIEGHVDSAQGMSVFWKLGEIKPGDQVIVIRQDRTRLTFTVDAVRDYPKASFPTASVYGGDLAQPSLRLITCSDFDAATHHHTGNEVVYTHLTHSETDGA